MRMYTTFTMDRPIDKDKHYISPGGYEFRFGEESVQFDFFDSCGGIDPKDQKKVNFELRNLDIDEFPESEKLLSRQFLKTLTEIEEFYVYTGEEGDELINLEKVNSIGFSHEDWEYVVPQRIINTYNKKLKEEQAVTKERTGQAK